MNSPPSGCESPTWRVRLSAVIGVYSGRRHLERVSFEQLINVRSRLLSIANLV